MEFQGWISPNGDVEAIADGAHRVLYFYLRDLRDNGFGVKDCWVRNLEPAPSSLDVGLQYLVGPPPHPGLRLNRPRVSGSFASTRAHRCTPLGTSEFSG
jgi:hypothetical protein